MRYGRDGIMYCESLDYTVQDYEINRFNSYKDAEYEMSEVLKGLDINNGEYYDELSPTGIIQYVNNPVAINFSLADYLPMATYTEMHLSNRRTLNGQFRVDPRLDVFDYITVVNKYATMNVVITTLNLSYNGGFNATYEGRVE
jgi:hypothetical protein